MLRNNFFTFSNPQKEGDIATTNIVLNGAHPIFEGHFPGQPVVPGACMMQMVKEVAEACIDKEIRLLKADDIKFLSFITPDDNKLIQMELKITSIGDKTRVDAKLLDNSAVLFKFRGTFVTR